MTDFFNKLKPRVRPLSTLTTFESLCTHISAPRHLLSQMYRLVLSGQYTLVPYFIREWERELNHTFTSLQIKKLI